MSREAAAKLLLVDDDDDFVLMLRYHLQDDFEVVGHASTGEQALTLVRELTPDVVLMDLHLPGMNGLEATAHLTRQFPLLSTIILSAHHDIQLMRDAMASGARDYVTKPIDPRALIDTVQRVAGQVRTRRRLLSQGERPPGAGVWAFCSPNGGSGQTTLTLAVANELCYLGKSVVLVDLDLDFGAVAFYLGLDQSGPDLVDLVRANPMNPPEVKDVLRTHGCGMQVLVPPADILSAHGLPAERVVATTVELQDQFDYVLVDMPHGLPDGYLELLEVSRYLFVPSSTGMGAIKNLRRFVQVMYRLEYPKEDLKILLAGDPDSARIEKVQQILQRAGMPVHCTLPRDRARCEDAVLSGQPVTRCFPESPYSQAVREFTLEILGIPAQDHKVGKRSLLSRLFG